MLTPFIGQLTLFEDGAITILGPTLWRRRLDHFIGTGDSERRKPTDLKGYRFSAIISGKVIMEV